MLVFFVFDRIQRGYGSRQVHSRTFRGDKEHFIKGRAKVWEGMSNALKTTRTQWKPFPSPPSLFHLRRVPTTSHRSFPRQTPLGPFAWCRRPFYGRSLPCIVPGSAPSNNLYSCTSLSEIKKNWHTLGPLTAWGTSRPCPEVRSRTYRGDSTFLPD